MEASSTPEQDEVTAPEQDEVTAPPVDPTAPAVEQSPVATAAGKVIVGDSGMYEQQPVNSASNVDTPLRTSAPPAELQSGVPLAEDRAAGVQPGQ